MNTTRFTVLAGMILAATATRFIPHPPNFSPIGALALFAGAHFANKRAAFLVPLVSLFLADLITGFHVLIPFVYGSFALNVCLGLMLRRNAKPWQVGTASLSASILFFVITNFGVWALLGTFPKTPAGLLACYAAGLPHFRNTVLGDLFYCLLLFGAFALAQRRFAGLREVQMLPTVA
jgi:hypothetical protein